MAAERCVSEQAAGQHGPEKTPDSGSKPRRVSETGVGGGADETGVEPSLGLANIRATIRGHRHEHGPEPSPLEPHRLVAHPDAAIVQEVLHVPEREREADIQHHRQADYFGRGPEVLKRAALGLSVRLGRPPAPLKPSSSDTTRPPSCATTSRPPDIAAPPRT